MVESNDSFNKYLNPFLYSGDKTIPSGATIVLSIFKVQRDEKYWGSDANQFNPERFERENFKKIPPYAYIPFTGT